MLFRDRRVILYNLLSNFRSEKRLTVPPRFQKELQVHLSRSSSTESSGMPINTQSGCHLKKIHHSSCFEWTWVWMRNQVLWVNLFTLISLCWGNVCLSASRAARRNIGHCQSQSQSQCGDFGDRRSKLNFTGGVGMWYKDEILAFRSKQHY